MTTSPGTTRSKAPTGRRKAKTGSAPSAAATPGTSRSFPLTVVVPTKNSARTLRRCLDSIRAQTDGSGRPFTVEIVVVDNHSTDDTPTIAASIADQFESNGPERSAQRNRGLSLATGELVLFIDSDMVLEPTVCCDVVEAFTRPDCAGVVVPEESFGQGFWASCRALEKQIALGDPRTEAARGFRVSTLRDTGAWNEALTAAEDWDLTDRVRASGGRIARTAGRIFHDEGHPTLRGNFQKKRYYGRWMAAYLQAPRASGGSPGSVDRPLTSRATRAARLSPLRILRRPGLLLPKPHVTLGLLTLKTVDAIGVGLGVMSARRQPTKPGGIAHQP